MVYDELNIPCNDRYNQGRAKISKFRLTVRDRDGLIKHCKFIGNYACTKAAEDYFGSNSFLFKLLTCA